LTVVRELDFLAALGTDDCPINDFLGLFANAVDVSMNIDFTAAALARHWIARAWNRLACLKVILAGIEDLIDSPEGFSRVFDALECCVHRCVSGLRCVSHLYVLIVSIVYPMSTPRPKIFRAMFCRIIAAGGAGLLPPANV
jgi:hypothetical protein